MKKNLFSFFLLMWALSGYAQVGTVTLSEPIENSDKARSIQWSNPLFKGKFLMTMATPENIVGLKGMMYLMDSATFKPLKKLEGSTYEGYIMAGMAMVDQNWLEFYQKTSKDKVSYYVAKTNEQLVESKTPEYLFTTDKSEIFSLLSPIVNDAKDLCLLFKHVENGKAKKQTTYIRIYDQNMKLLKADSMVTAADNKDTLSALVYENGYILQKQNITNTLFVEDVKNSKSFTLQLPKEGAKPFSVQRAKLISGNQLAVFGSYATKGKGGKVDCGYFKMIYDLTTSTIKESILFDHARLGKWEELKSGKLFLKSLITEDGSCYAIIGQEATKADANGRFSTFILKPELVCIKDKATQWKKQLPIADEHLSSMSMLFTNNHLYIVFRQYEKENSSINHNEYVFGEPFPTKVSDLAVFTKANISLLKIDAKGTIAHQAFPDLYYDAVMPYGNCFMGIHRGMPGDKVVKPKFIKIIPN